MDAIPMLGDRVTFCVVAQVLSLRSAGCLAIVELALDRSVFFRGLGVADNSTWALAL
jgi:hypothetical protein